MQTERHTGRSLRCFVGAVERVDVGIAPYGRLAGQSDFVMDVGGGALDASHCRSNSPARYDKWDGMACGRKGRLKGRGDIAIFINFGINRGNFVKILLTFVAQRDII